MNKTLAASIIAVAFYNPLPVFAAVVDFSSLSESGTGFLAIGNTVMQNGFKFSSVGGAGNELGVWKNEDSNHPDGGAVNTSLLEYYAGSETTMTEINGNPFQLNAISLASWGVGQNGSMNVTFIGTKSDSSTVQQTFLVSNSGGSTPFLQQFQFSSEFTDVTSVSFIQGTYAGSSAYQFNNIVVNAVPVPAAIWLFSSALVGIGLIGKRHNSSASA
jgi:hypothetical protein